MRSVEPAVLGGQGGVGGGRRPHSNAGSREGRAVGTATHPLPGPALPQA